MIPQKKYQHLNIHIDRNKKLSINDFMKIITSEWTKQQTVMSVFPKGLYFSCGPSFYNNFINGEVGSGNWLSDDNPVYNLILDNSKIIHIKNINQLDQLYENFKGKGPFKKQIDWKKLSVTYSGIRLPTNLKPKIQKIKNYREKFHYVVFYNFDGASGCIWNSDCILDIKYGGNLGKFKSMNNVSKKLDSILLNLSNMM